MVAYLASHPQGLVRIGSKVFSSCWMNHVDTQVEITRCVRRLGPSDLGSPAHLLVCFPHLR
jgi:hypothetical protein